MKPIPNLKGEIAAFTGHRPTKLGGYGDDARFRLRGLAVHFLSISRPSKVISGMALGWDQAVCEAALSLHIPVIAAVPCDWQERLWPDESKVRYRKLLAACAKTIVVCPGSYAPWKMQRRNEWMVDECDRLIALWDGSTGGTANCVDYANRVGTETINLWDLYVYRGGRKST